MHPQLASFSRRTLALAASFWLTLRHCLAQGPEVKPTPKAKRPSRPAPLPRLTAEQAPSSRRFSNRGRSVHLSWTVSCRSNGTSGHRRRYDCGCVKDGKLLFASGYGYSDYEKKTPVSPRTLSSAQASFPSCLPGLRSCSRSSRASCNSIATSTTYLDFKFPRLLVNPPLCATS